MILRVLSDASYLSRPNAGSVAGSFHFLGSPIDDSWVNHPISAHSTKIPVVCSFVAESEYAGIFAAARIATDERQILANFGHIQPPTPLYCDDECAVGIANSTVTQKMSKALDMRLHWIRDRIQQGQFIFRSSGICRACKIFRIFSPSPSRLLAIRLSLPFSPWMPTTDETWDTVVDAKLKLSALLFAACVLTPASSGLLIPHKREKQMRRTL